MRSLNTDEAPGTAARWAGVVEPATGAPQFTDEEMEAGGGEK